MSKRKYVFGLDLGKPGGDFTAIVVSPGTPQWRIDPEFDPYANFRSAQPSEISYADYLAALNKTAQVADETRQIEGGSGNAAFIL